MCLISVAFQQPLWSDNGQLGAGVIGRTCRVEILSSSLSLPLLLHPSPSPHPSPLMFTPQLCSLPPLPGTLPAPPFLEMTLHLPTSTPSVPMERPNPQASLDGKSLTSGDLRSVAELSHSPSAPCFSSMDRRKLRLGRKRLERREKEGGKIGS